MTPPVERLSEEDYHLEFESLPWPSVTAEVWYRLLAEASRARRGEEELTAELAALAKAGDALAEALEVRQQYEQKDCRCDGCLALAAYRAAREGK